MTSILDHQPLKIWPFPIKTEVSWVPGIYIYIYPRHDPWDCQSGLPIRPGVVDWGSFWGGSPMAVPWVVSGI